MDLRRGAISSPGRSDLNVMSTLVTIDLTNCTAWHR